HVAGAASPLADDVHAGALAGADVLVEPGGDVGWHEHVPLDAEPGLRLRRDRLEGLEETLPQHPELQTVEDLVDLLTVPALPLEVLYRHVDRHVADQLVEPPIAQHAVEVLAQGVAHL